MEFLTGMFPCPIMVGRKSNNAHFENSILKPGKIPEIKSVVRHATSTLFTYFEVDM